MVLHEHKVLVYHADAHSDGIPRRVESYRFSVDAYRALIGAVQPIEDVHEGGFPGSVLAQEAQNFSGGDGEVDVAIGGNSMKGFEDAGHLQLLTLIHCMPLADTPSSPMEQGCLCFCSRLLYLGMSPTTLST